MIADPNLSILTRADIRQKIGKLEKKLTTVEKLISILKNAISKSVAETFNCPSEALRRALLKIGIVVFL